VNVAGRDCSLVLIAGRHLVSLPYAEETLRNRYLLVAEEAVVDGGGRAVDVLRPDGATGCIVTRLGLSTAPILLALVLGAEDPAFFVSGTRSVYAHPLALDYRETGTPFDVVADHVNDMRLFRRLYPRGWELRVMRGNALYLKLDCTGTNAAEDAPVLPGVPLADEEHFHEDGVTVRVNGSLAPSVYGVVVTVKRGRTTRAEIALHRSWNDADAHLFGERIDTLEIEARLWRDGYEDRRTGRFVLDAEALALLGDGTSVNCAGEVIGPLRYLVTGSLGAEVYSTDGERLLP